MVIPRQQSPDPGIPWVLNFPSFKSENFKPKEFLGEAGDAHRSLGSCSGSSSIPGEHIFKDEGASGRHQGSFLMDFGDFPPLSVTALCPGNRCPGAEIQVFQQETSGNMEVCVTFS